MVNSKLQAENFLQWGIARAQQQDWPAALQSLDQALWIDPDLAAAYLNRGVVYYQLGETAKALQDLDRTISLSPMLALAYYSRSLVHQVNGNYREAIADAQQATSLNSQYSEVLSQLGQTLLGAGQPDNAIPCLTQYLQYNPTDAATLYHLGRAYRLQGEVMQAVQALKRAVQFGNTAAAAELLSLYGEQVPSWHFPMMSEPVRNAAYQQAIERAVTPESLVLEIGTGAGLLAMVAARAGARRVITCEAVELVAAKAREIIRLNGFSETQIQVIPKHSTSLTIPADLPEKVDILITETFDTSLIGEGAFLALPHAIAHLTRPDAKLIPCGVTIYFLLLESLDLYHEFRVQSACGFDLSPFNEFANPPAPVWSGQIAHYPYRVLSQAYPVATLNFYQQEFQIPEQLFEIEVTVTGECHCFCSWFDLQMDAETILSSNPLEAGTEVCKYTWSQRSQILENPLQLQRGQKLILRLKSTDASFYFELMQAQG